VCVTKAHIALLILNLSNGVDRPASCLSCYRHDTRTQYPLNWSHKNTMIFYIVGVHTSPVSEYHGNYICYGGAKYLWICSTELASCHLLASSIEIPPSFLETLCTPAVWTYEVQSTLQFYSWQSWQHRTVTTPYTVWHDTTDNALMADELAQ
jgi:hypothetical protein